MTPAPKKKKKKKKRNAPKTNIWVLKKERISLLFSKRNGLIGFIPIYFKMAMMPLVPETKMADVGKLISLRNRLLRKVTWLVLTTTSVTLILSPAFGADCMTKIANIYSRLPRTHSLSILTSRGNTHTHTHPLSLSLSYILTSSSQCHENVYILQPFSFLFCLFG